MISTTQIANEIESRLNEIAAGANLPFVFRIYANIGEYKAAEEDPMRKKLPTPVVNGVLIAFPAQIVPLQGVKSFAMQQLLTIYAPVKPNAEVNSVGIEEVMSVVNAFVESGAGKAGAMSDGENNYAYVLAPQLPSVGSEGWELGMPAIPVSISLAWQFIEGGIISNEIGITVNGQSLVLLDGGVVRTRVVETYSPVGGEGLVSAVAQQGLTLRITTPYLNAIGSVALSLVQALWSGALAQSYTVTYNDGTVSKSVEMVATEITENWSSGTVVSVTATFVPADTNVYPTTTE
jgi:hypothetical protein